MDLVDSLASRIIRVALGRPPQPRVDLFQVAWSVGVRNIRATNFRDGFTDFRSQSPVIFLNRHDSGPRMRFILAHEIAHVILRMPEARSELEMSGWTASPANEEDLADSIATSILIPDNWIAVLRKAELTLTGLERTAHLADVPLMVLVNRMSSVQIDVCLLHWMRGDRSWHVVNRSGSPSFFRGCIELSEPGRRKFEKLVGKESMVSVDALVDGVPRVIAGLTVKRGEEVYQLVESSLPIRVSDGFA